MRSGSDQQIIAGAVAGRPLGEIASAAGVSRSTVQRRRREPLVRAEIERLRGVQRDEALAQYGRLRQQALARLSDLVGSEDEALALKAVNVVLGSAINYERFADLESRVHEMEAASNETTALDGGR